MNFKRSLAVLHVQFFVCLFVGLFVCFLFIVHPMDASAILGVQSA